jgi:hypothetical protein
MTTVTKKLVTSEDTTEIGVLSIHTMTDWLNSAVKMYDKTYKKTNSNNAKMTSLELHKPVFIDDVLSFDCETMALDNGESINVKVLRNNLPVIESMYQQKR